MSILPLAMASLGAVILSYGDPAEAVGCVDNLLAQGLHAEDLLVVHNPGGSGDTTFPPLPGAIGVLHPTRNLGYAGGMNAGIKEMLKRNHSHLALVTHDTRLEPAAIERLYQWLDDDTYGVLGVVMTESITGDKHFGGSSINGICDHIRTLPADPLEILPCDWVEGAFITISRRAFERVGLLDERLFMYSEEPDFCLRVRRAGWQVGVVRDAGAVHTRGETRRVKSVLYLRSRNGFEYARRAEGAAGVRSYFPEMFDRPRGMARAALGPRSPASLREPMLDLLVPRALGFLAFLARRWGAPPAWLARDGDIRV